MRPVEFADPAFRLACLDILFDQGLFVDEWAEARDRFPADQGNADTLNHGRYRFLMALPVTQWHLDQITSFAPDGGDDLYFDLIPGWNGEDDQVYLSGSRDFRLLRNLEDVSIHAVTRPACIDLADLVALPKLSSVALSRYYLHLPSFEAARQQLIAQGAGVLLDGV